MTRATARDATEGKDLMAYIDITCKTIGRAATTFDLLSGVADSNGDTVEDVSIYTCRYFAEDVRSAVDGLIEAEIIDPTEDSYFIHE